MLFFILLPLLLLTVGVHVTGWLIRANKVAPLNTRAPQSPETNRTSELAALYSAVSPPKVAALFYCYGSNVNDHSAAGTYRAKHAEGIGRSVAKIVIAASQGLYALEVGYLNALFRFATAAPCST
ncbi:hypothetical protein [Pseudomonas cremoris]|uniref:hypothetical protein n=1 Tax=Pseudomonas cremoris TaxID=2724178 RepID=UPI002897DD7B|nr:hypothetical protein [Pseudomonas cremoris]